MTVREALHRERRSLGRPLKLVDWARLEPDVLVVTLVGKHATIDGGYQHEVRCVSYAGERQMYSSIVQTTVRP